MARRRHASYAEIEALPEHLIGEIIDGELIVSPRPAPPHALAGSAIGGSLFDRFNRPPGGGGGPGGWWILDEPELHLLGDVIVPDMSGWRRVRLPQLPETAAFGAAPDWACEVVSPRSTLVDRVRKMRIYARARVGHVWIVDPLARSLEVFRLTAGKWLLISTHAGNERARAEPFSQVEIDLARWWPDAPPPAKPARKRHAARRRK